MSFGNVQIKIILQAVDQATAALKRANDSVKRLTNSIQGLKDVAKVAAGVLIRDFALSLGRNIKEASELGAKYASLRSAFRNLVGDASEANQLFRELRRATRGTVSAVKLLQAANQALALGLPKDELADLFEAAMRLGYAMGKDTVSSIDDLVTGLGRLSGKILDNLGIVVKTEEAYEWYAKQLGKTVNELTELERRTAWQLYAMEQIKKKADEVGDAESTAQENLERWNTTIKDFKTYVGRVVGPLGELGNIVGGFATPLLLTVDNWGKLGEVLDEIKTPISKVLDLLGPWKWAIIGIIAATLILAWVWKNNLGNIQNITKKWVDNITNALKGVGKWIDEVGKEWAEVQRKVSEKWTPIVERFTGKTIEQIVEDAVNRTAENIDKAVQLVENLDEMAQEGILEPMLEVGAGPTYTPPPRRPTSFLGEGPWGGAERFTNVTIYTHIDKVESDYDVDRFLTEVQRRLIEEQRRLK